MKENTNKRHSVLFKVLRGVGIVLLAVVVLFAGLIGFLSVTEYKPADVETLTVAGEAARQVRVGDSLTLMSWNIGYGALGDNADFFMDGGSSVKTADKARVNANMQGVMDEISSVNPDVFFLQEVDRKSSRSNRVNEYAQLQGVYSQYQTAFAGNFKVAFLPYPVPPIGKVDSGIATFSAFPIASAERRQLPIPFSWPVRMANLKRCLLVSRVNVADSDKQLVFVNLHLEAYDDGEGKVAQTKMLAEFLATEAQKGNYVIAGGDFNQIFSSADKSAYPAEEGKWAAGEIDVTQFGGTWQFLMDAATPSCRSLDQPYENADKATFQYYLIDGFIVSANVQVDSCQNRDLGFKVSDHNPVVLKITLN